MFASLHFPVVLKPRVFVFRLREMMRVRRGRVEQGQNCIQFRKISGTLRHPGLLCMVAVLLLVQPDAGSGGRVNE